MIRSEVLFMVCALALIAAATCAQSLSYSGTPALLNNVTMTMQGAPNEPYVLAASDTPGPTVIAPLGAFELGYPPIIIAGAVPGLPIVPSLDPNGMASISFDIPFNSSLIGTTWWFQGVVLDPSSPYGISKTNGVHFTIANPLLAPTVTSVTPNSGPSTGGSQVAIFGTNFLPGGTTVTVGTAPLGNLVVATPQLITGTIPPGAPGTSVPISVTTLIGGTSILANAWTYQGNSAPSIASVTPDHAPINGGVAFTLTGQSLGQGTVVYVNGMAATPIAQSFTTYVGILPAVSSPGYANILAVSTAGVASLANTFRYTAVYDLGTGADGVFAPTSNVLLNTTNNGGIYNFTCFTIPAGVTVTGRGPNPMVIKCTGTISIAGTLDVSGESGAFVSVTEGVAFSPTPSRAGAGGFDGNWVSYVPGYTGPSVNFPGPFQEILSWNPTSSNLSYYSPSHGTGPYPYGSPTLSYLIGGSGAFAAPSSCINIPQIGPSIYLFTPVAVSTGGAGGGAVSLQGSNIQVSGVILANGGAGHHGASFACPPPPSGFSVYTAIIGYTFAGSGGAIRVMSGSPLLVGANSLQTKGGMQFTGQGVATSSNAGNGRWAVYSWNGTVTYGTDGFIPQGTF